MIIFKFKFVDDVVKIGDDVETATGDHDFAGRLNEHQIQSTGGHPETGMSGVEA